MSVVVEHWNGALTSAAMAIISSQPNRPRDATVREYTRAKMNSSGMPVTTHMTVMSLPDWSSARYSGVNAGSVDGILVCRKLNGREISRKQGSTIDERISEAHGKDSKQYF